MRILFINPAPYKGRRYNIPPFGLIYLISYYNRFGRFSGQVDFKIYDENCQSDEDLLPLLQDFKPDLVGISCNSLLVNRAKELISLVRAWNSAVPILGGGVHFQIDKKGDIFPLDVNVAFTGEAEIPFKNFVDQYFEEKRLSESWLSKTAGIGFKSPSVWQITPEGEQVTNLDFLSYLDFSYLNEDHYFRKKYEFYPGLTGRFLTILTSRGCPFTCNFCFNSFNRKPMRYHSIDYVLELLNFFVRKYKTELVWINDDLFLADKDRVTEFCRKLIRSNLKVRWACQARADILFDKDKELLKLMKEAGCLQIGFGFESGSDKVLRFLKGGNSSVASNQRAVDLVSASGIRVFGYFMVGIPTETKEDLEATKTFVEKNLDKLAFYEVYVFTPLPGAQLWDVCKQQGLLDNISFPHLVNNMFSMDFSSFRSFSKDASKEDIFVTKAYLKQLIVRREPLINKIRNFLLYFFKEPGRTLSKLLYYAGFKKVTKGKQGKPRILILNHNQERFGTYYRCLFLGKGLAARGYQVTMICASGRKFDLLIRKKKISDNFTLITLPRIKYHKYFTGQLLLRLPLTVLLVILLPYDVCYAFTVAQLQIGIPAWFSRIIRRKKLIVDWDDLWGNGFGLEHGGFVSKVIYWSERYFIKFAHRVTYVSQFLGQKFADLFLPIPAVKIPNGANTQQIAVLDRDECCRHLTLDPAKKYLVSIGNTYTSSLGLLLRAFEAVIKVRDDVYLVMVGEGKITPEFQELYSRLVSRIISTGKQPFSQVPYYLGCADALLLPMDDTDIEKARFPMRFGDYLCAGRPIVSNAVGEVEYYLSKYQAGLISPVSDSEVFSYHILLVLASSEIGYSYGRKARELAEGDLNWEKIIDRLTLLLEGLINHFGDENTVS
ncbi:hypothetical protein COT52_02675 [candidate division WWE3 bacterium CG08_land_8_20_14_0_20_43_13]|uniref:Uncharacterized protein n=1 Tax=candidate division WWE3 bacterium CG08_land_8_20_14_0_20_43_13 TaxID=1975087 RepID=A0A2H0X8X1_UNCKA|nr:MAG: hypothetical protein COT52_02675 [candidate division WWE3 bacterium CG08_land_8_20_14_0_20_43_13]